MKNKRKKLSIDKYNYGSYVIANQQSPNNIPQVNTGANIVSGVATGANIGNTVGDFIGDLIPIPGAGAILGGIGGAVAGLFTAGKRRRERKRQIEKNNQNMLGAYEDQFNSMIDTVNENPYGTYAEGGDIHIKPSKKGTFTAAAKKRGKGVQEFASQVLANKDNYSPAMVKKANFAKNASKWNKHAEGGEVLPSMVPINIERGELEIDPETGQILRDFTGINPETGGLYQPHSSGKKKESPNNMVTAKEGSFIITKAKAKEYKDALDNNDQLHQNSIMHNIRKNKRNSLKFANGGLVNPVDNLFPYINMEDINNLIKPMTGGGVKSTINSNNQITESAPLTSPTSYNSASVNNTQADTGFNFGNLVQFLPAVSNLIQGISSPNYLDNSRSPVNPYRNRVLSSMPREIGYSPLFSRIYRDRNNAYNIIDETTNSSAVARANKLNVMANTQRGIQDAFFQGEDYNNRIRAQRAGLLDQLGQQDINQFMQDRQYNLGIDMTNRQMREGRRQQFNYGLSQIGELYNNMQTNRQLENRDADLLDLLPQIYPALELYLMNYRSRRNNG